MSKCSRRTQHSNEEDLALGIHIHKGSKYSVIHIIKGNVWKNCSLQPQEIKSLFLKLGQLSFRYLFIAFHSVEHYNTLYLKNKQTNK